jgi:multidrug efflux pump subunit AcrA (membrane-fusion protein)
VDDSYSYVVLSMSVNGAEVTLSDPLPEPEVEEEEEEPEESEDTGYYDPGITYTAAELAQMIADQEQKVRGLELDIRQSKLSYEKLKQEAENNTVYAEFDGTVTMVAEDPENLALIDPMMEVSAGGCYTVTAVLGEFDLDGVSVGQTVEVNVYGDSYTSCEGVITWISEYPTTDSDSYYYYYSGGNSNISKYPFTVQIDGGENLKEGDYAEIYYSSEGQEKSGLYLENEFIRSENGKSYVYVEVDGKLEKRYVSTGTSLWGSYTEIRSGLTLDDYLAFPYGTGVKDGANATEADISELYSSAGYY